MVRYLWWLGLELVYLSGGSWIENWMYCRARVRELLWRGVLVEGKNGGLIVRALMIIVV